jgi:catechol 2,3-dioxygenase-like lactoylglutathione lyase family enzyme
MMTMAKLRHIAIATNDPKATAEFYKKAFGFEQIGETSPTSPLAQGYFLSDGTLNIAVLKFKTDQIGKGMDYTGVHHFGILVDDPEKATEHLESLGAECFMGKEKGHGKGFFEIKFKGPDGTVFDIAGHPWMGSKGLEG